MQYLMLIPNIMLILHENQCLIVIISTYEYNFLTFCHRFRKNWFSQRGNKSFWNRYVTLFAIVWRFEWHMAIKEKFWNEGLHRSERKTIRHIACSPLSIYSNMVVVSNVPWTYMKILSFRRWIRINYAQKITVIVNGRNPNFSSQRSFFHFFGFTLYFRNSSPKTWSKII